MLDAVFSKEHVLGAAEADAFGAEQAGLLGVARDVGVGTDAQLADRVNPAHELDQIGIVRLSFKRLQAPCDHAAGSAVQREPVALFVGMALDAQFLLRFVDRALAGAGHAALAHAARYDCRV